MSIDNGDGTKEILTLIAEAAKSMGWKVALEIGEREEEVVGLIIGKQDYIERVLKGGTEHEIIG